MIQKILSVTGVFFCVLLLFACAPDWETWDNSVIRLQTIVGDKAIKGTAFAINANGDYVTNHHVIEEALKGNKLEAVESVEPQLKTHPAEVIWHDASRDLAVVRVASWRNPPLPLAAGNRLRKGAWVRTSGFPENIPNTVDEVKPVQKDGSVSLLWKGYFTDPVSLFQIIEHQASINSGNSGGPLADKCKRVVGVNTAKPPTRLNAEDLQQRVINTSEGRFLSVSSNELMASLRAKNIAFTEDTSECIPPAATPPALLYAVMGILALMIGVLAYLYIQLKRLLPAGAGVKEVSRLLVARLQHRPLPAPPPRPMRDPETGAVLDKDMMARLLPLQAGMPLLFLRRGSQILGRTEAGQADALIPHPQVSARHLCLILNPDGSAGVEDLQSTNGSRLDNQPLAPGQIYPLRSGQVLELGGVAYQFEASA